MSVEVTTAVWRYSRAKQGALLVLLCLADHADVSGVCWPGEERVARKAKLEERQVRRVLVALDEMLELDRWHYRDGRRWRQVFRITVAEYAEFRGLRPSGFTEIELCYGAPPTGRPTGQNVRSTRPDISDDSTGHIETFDRTSAASAPYIETSEESSGESRPRPRDPIWDTLTELFGDVVAKTNAHSKRNKAVGDLRKLDATEEQIRAAHKRWSQIYGDATITDIALATHFPQLKVRFARTTDRITRLETFVRNIGWQYPDRELTEELRSFNAEDDDLPKLLELASDIRRSQSS